MKASTSSEGGTQCAGRCPRRLSLGAALLTLLMATFGSAAAQERLERPAPVSRGDVSVTTLGTAGGPPPHTGRSQPATLLQVGAGKYLIDAGEGAAYQLRQAGIAPNSLAAIFVTHLHWDHTLGLDYLMATDWMSGRTHGLPVLGPPGLDKLVLRQLAAVSVGEEIFRAQAPNRPRLSDLYPAREIATCQPSVVFRDDLVTVTSVCNSHFAEVRAPAHDYGEDRALSYRFDTAAGSVTFTGDTGPSPEVERLAKGSDILVAEIVDLSSIGRALRRVSPNQDISRLMTHMARQHLTAEALGALATRAEVKKLVVTHFVMGADVDPNIFESQLRSHFAGQIVVGRDLARVTLN